MPQPAIAASPSTLLSGRCSPITGSDIHAAILGRYSTDMVIHRQAWRITDDDSDELILLQVRREWWVGRRISDRTTVWACQSGRHAASTFEELLADGRDRGNWHEATPRAHAA
jgi:hypothetical protein